ncbi:MAG TPA: M14 metallopeptidase family protein [Granulicella sp.]
MKNLFRAALFVAVLVPPALAATPKTVTSPKEAFGFEPGTDRKLADWKELTAYYQKVASQSDRVRYQEIGKTMEGRPFVLLTVSAPENLAKLAEYKDINAKLADPRTTTPEQAKALIAKGKTVMIITFNIHSTEIASSQTAAAFVYKLATSSDPEVLNVLKNTILLLVPSQNPDGEQLVVDYYKKTLGTPSEGSNPPVLYAKYVGHDDNRDWVGLTQNETKHTAKVINEWHPQILYDLHQMGANAARLYLPPWVDPIDPNVDPLLVYSMNALGMRTAHDVAATGKTGIVVNGVYDFWSPLRDYISLRNGLRILTESASANIATPIEVPFEKLGTGIGYDAKVAKWNYPDPWKGGTWHLGDIVAYQMDALASLTKSAANDREQFLKEFYEVSDRAVHPASGPYAYVVAPGKDDPAEIYKLVKTLQDGGVEIQQSTSSFEADGKSYPAGTFVISLEQPFRSYAKTVLERQKYPDIREYPGGPPQRPYDVTGTTLPLFYSVNAVAVESKFTAQTKKLDVIPVPVGHVDASATSGYLLENTSNNSLYALFALLSDGVKAYRLTGSGYTPGTIYVPAQPGVAAKLEAVIKKFPVDFKAAPSAPTGSALAVTAPRVGLYKSWVAALDEGWTRFVLDSNSVPYKTIYDADIKKGDLKSQFDAIVIPDNNAQAIIRGLGGNGGGEGGRGGANRLNMPVPPEEYRGGLGQQGIDALKAFVEAGGTIITDNKAGDLYARKDNPEFSNALNGVPPKEFYCPGSILEIAVDPTNPVAFGSPATIPVFFETGPAFKVSGEAKAVGRYTSDNPLLSGWILGGKYLNGNAAIADVPVGKGRIVAFGFQPMYRALSEMTYKFLLNAMLYSTSTPTTVSASAALTQPPAPRSAR